MGAIVTLADPGPVAEKSFPCAAELQGRQVLLELDISPED